MTAPIQNSWLWSTSSSGDGSASGYTQSDWSKILKVVGSCHGLEGVGDYLNEYSASHAFETVLVDTGGALVDGKPHECTTAGSVAVTSAVGAGNTRIDRIALRANWAGGASPNTVRIVNIPGIDAAIPTAPSLTTTSETTYDIALWQALVNESGIIALTDERNYADITSSCAIAASMITADKIGTNEIVTDHILASNVTAAKLATDAVETAKIKAANVTLAKMAVNSIDSDQYVDGSIDTVHIADANVTLAKLAADSVDDTKAGNRVPALTRRQGGSATIWNTSGATNYTPTAVRMQCGCNTSGGDGTIAVTFPTAFSASPLVLLQAIIDSDQSVTVESAPATTGFTAFAWNQAGTAVVGLVFHWLAIGPEA